jgi:hypothetical protein
MTTFPQRTIGQILDSERVMVLAAPERFGEHYLVAQDCALFATQFLKSLDPDRWVFAKFQALAKKHLTLALFSTVRLHKVQAMMDLRQAMEAGASAAYAIANPDHKDFVTADQHGILNPSQKLTGKRNKWLDQNYPDASKAIQEIKDKINASSAHANLISAYGMSEANVEEGWFSEFFFDVEDAHFVKTDLWLVANATLTVLHVYNEVNEGRNVLKLVDDFGVLINRLGRRNEAVKQQLTATDRFKRAAELEKARSAPPWPD